MHPSGRCRPRSPLRISILPPHAYPSPLSLSLYLLSLSRTTNKNTSTTTTASTSRRGVPRLAPKKSGKEMSMDSEVPAAPVVDKVSQLAETSVNGRSHPSKKNQGKVPVRIHKSEREKMKREHLNELFIALANALGPSQQNNGKASILGETTRLLKEMHAQIEGLRRENAALLSESQYVSIEKNELRDENSALESQIVKLRIELQERVVHSKPDLNVPPPEEPSHFSLEQPALQQASPYVSPFYVIPVCSDSQAYSEQDTTQPSLKPTTNVSKPHARYPTPSDSWPSQLLGKQQESS